MEAQEEEREVSSIFARVFDLDGGAKKRKSPQQQPSEQHAEMPEHHTHNPAKAVATKEHDTSKGDSDHGDSNSGDGFGFGGAKSPYWLRGGAGQIDLLSMFEKFGYLFLVVLISIGLATFLITSPNIYQRFFDPERDEDYNFDSSDATHGSRYKKIFKVVFLFHILILICFLIVLLVIYGILALYYEAAGLKKQGVVLLDMFKKMLFTFDNFGTDMSVSDFYLTFIIVLIVGFLFYFFYFKYVVNYFANMTFPSYVNPEKSDHPEWENPKKFIILYGLMIMYIFAFALMVMNYVYGFTSMILFIWNVIFLFFLMLFMGMVYKYVLMKEPLRMNIWIIVLVLFVIGNKYLGGMFKHALDTMFEMFKKTH